jgi:hypothetical protein
MWKKVLNLKSHFEISFTNGHYLVLGIKATFPKGVIFKNQNDFLFLIT